jgi:hypothetical protein
MVNVTLWWKLSGVLRLMGIIYPSTRDVKHFLGRTVRGKTEDCGLLAPGGSEMSILYPMFLTALATRNGGDDMTKK